MTRVIDMLMGRTERLSTPLGVLRKGGQKLTTVLTMPEYDEPGLPSI